jgi:hypothetical protein
MVVLDQRFTIPRLGDHGLYRQVPERERGAKPDPLANLSPYVFLFLATTMFYWFPLALIYKPLLYVYAILFVISTVLNVTSHKGPKTRGDTGS